MLISYLTELSKANPVLTSTFGIYSAGLVTFLFRNLPSSIVKSLCSQLVTTVNITTDNTGFSDENFEDFLLWWSSNKWGKYSRDYKLISIDRGTIGGEALGGQSRSCPDIPTPSGVLNKLSAGYSRNFFIFNGTLFWFRQYRLEQQPFSSKIVYSIDIVGLTRNFGKIKELITAAIQNRDFKEDYLRVSSWNSMQSSYSTAIRLPKRSVDSVVMPAGVKENLLTLVDEFRVSRSWYLSRGLPYKLTFVLHGAPGTGKTSIVKAIASRYNYTIHSINIATCTDSDFTEAFREAYENSIILIEDMDASSTAISRFTKPTCEHPSSSIKKLNSVSLTTILNTLDGVVQLNNTIVFITTNCLETLDEALLRKGRVDHIVEVGPLADADIREYIKVMYAGATISDNYTFPDTRGCVLQSLFIENKHCAESFARALVSSVESVK